MVSEVQYKIVFIKFTPSLTEYNSTLNSSTKYITIIHCRLRIYSPFKISNHL